MPFRVNPRQRQAGSGLAIRFLGVLNHYGAFGLAPTRHVVTLFQIESVGQNNTFTLAIVSSQVTVAIPIS